MIALIESLVRTQHTIIFWVYIKLEDRMKIEEKLINMGIALPNLEDLYRANKSGAKYVSHHAIGSVLYLSGCTPTKDGKPFLPGLLGKDLSVEEGYAAARHTMICYLGMIKYVLGDLDRVKTFLHMVGYVNSSEGFSEQPRVVNGAVDLLVEVYGNRGMPTRAAIGCRGLASNHSVELILTLEFDGKKTSEPLARDKFNN
jgi:enamine deaminase RidA (YjgF/YER057c/UK114 family)